jgi:1D-myo-inositol-tetrakisphosphate 5-kinase/inositol-polyphosphate multikinase
MINLESLSISSASPPPLPIDLLIPLLRSILYRLNELLELLGTLEWTCRSGSVLLIYEGDVDALRAAFERTGTREGDERRSFTPTPDSPPRSYSIGDSKEVDHKHTSGRNDSDQVKEEQEDEEEEDENETSDEDSTTSSGSPHPNSMRVFDIRLIDFAHTTSQGKGSGIDHGLVQGVHSLIDIVAELLRETEAVSV